jgi:glutathione synthase/RimK-type ligase-like ATP-grasp enzyme
MSATTKTMLLLSQPGDGHLPPVKEALLRMGCRVLECDLADFPERLQLTVQLASAPWNGVLSYQGQEIAFGDIVSVWWRRPQVYRASADYSPAVRTFLEQEAYRGFLGLLQSQPGPVWVSRPDHIRAAEFKPAQLAAAQAQGLRVPRTLLTNQPGSAREFYQACQGRVVSKAVWRGMLDVPDEQPGQPRFMYTSRVQDEHLAWLDGVSTTAHLFQEYIEKRVEVRVIIVGRQVFAVEIRSQQAERTLVDFRRSFADLEYAVHQLPLSIEQQLLQLTRFFGLEYSSIDLIVTMEGEYVYLEQNPNGQSMWLAEATGLPVAEALASLLREPEVYSLC